MVVPTQTRASILRHLRKRAISSSDAEDALQEACIRFITASPSVQNEQEAVSWLLTVAHRCLIDYHRHADTHTAPLYDTHTAPLDGPEATVIAAVVVRSALQTLPEADRVLLALKSDGWECDEIAVMWSISLETVKKRLQRARGRLRRTLIVLGEPDPNSWNKSVIHGLKCK